MDILDVTQFLLIRSSTAMHIFIQSHFKINFLRINSCLKGFMHVKFTFTLTTLKRACFLTPHQPGGGQLFNLFLVKRLVMLSWISFKVGVLFIMSEVSIFSCLKTIFLLWVLLVPLLCPLLSFALLCFPFLSYSFPILSFPFFFNCCCRLISFFEFIEALYI